MCAWTEPVKIMDGVLMLSEFLGGVCVGSFLNVLATRTLAEESIFTPRSHCPKCKHPLAILDLVPVLSWLFLRGRCRHCHESIAWYYPFVEIFTGITFILIGMNFGWNWGAVPTNHFNDASVFNCTGWAMAYFACMLITISITDFKEKLIPHDITYPSMLVGIIYSANNPNVGILNSLAGAGISYILFDFLAFYGLKLYERSHRIDAEGAEQEKESGHEQDEKVKLDAPAQENAPPQASAPSESFDVVWLIDPPDYDAPREIIATEKHHAIHSEIHSEIDAITPEHVVASSALETAVPGKAVEDDEDFEVMGGGDAVLSAVIAVWLGLRALGFVLLTGFMIGTFMGAIYLIIEMVKQKAMHKAYKAILICSAILLTMVEGFLYFLYSLQYPYNPNGPNVNYFFQRMPWLPMGVGAIIGGVILGTVLKGSKYSKPFPFGPALAVAAFVCIFFNPFDIQDAPGALMEQVRNSPILRR
jgi:prepilin signal peptidase PulO-like enzyme (type II secretory pathway)